MNREELNTKWEQLTYHSKDHFKYATLLQLHALQFIAIAGRYLAKPQKNENHIAMQWYLSKKMLVGTWIDAKQYPIKIGIRLDNLKLKILNPSFTEIDSLYLQGHTKGEAFDWLNEKMKMLKAEMGRMKMELNYPLPYHETEDGEPFEIRNKDEMVELTKLRTNTHLVLKQISTLFQNVSPIQVWPHNFNTYFTIPIEEDGADKLLKYINVGLAIPDEFFDRYYFFVSHCDKDELADYDKLKKLEGDGLWTTRDRVIAILPINKFYCDKTKEDQVKRILSFLISALNNTLDILVCPEMKIPN